MWLKTDEIPDELIDTNIEVWLLLNKEVFIGYFYRAYGGLNYCCSNYDTLPKKIKGIHIDNVSKLDGYQLIIKPKY